MSEPATNQADGTTEGETIYDRIRREQRERQDSERTRRDPARVVDLVNGEPLGTAATRARLERAGIHF